MNGSNSQKRLLNKWLLFQIATLTVASFGMWVHPTGSLKGALFLGIPAFVILSLTALLIWWLEERSRNSLKTKLLNSTATNSVPKTGFLRIQLRYQFLPWILSQIILIPYALYFGRFTLTGGSRGWGGVLSMYGIGILAYIGLIFLPLFIFSFLAYKKQGKL